ncbi:Ivy family c-type lysozyme inhibitor [Sulfuritalea hydrogenivorans]|uniref:Ivy family c-type lysozyme inhibitor n=1 Tax=Sulfuritalea hydrogenivorans TaxID=748811 RepID=UPI001494882C|nr:Ivy family c-type lysozyme inhibitor [Sulfuritalea hydrogenivorans]
MSKTFRSIAVAHGLLLSISATAADYPWTLLKSPTFKTAYFKMLGPNQNAPWLRKLHGPSAPVEYVQLVSRNEEFVLLDVCKPHDCGNTNALILYSEARGAAFALLFTDGTAKYLGSPPDDVKDTLSHHFEKRRSK